MHCVIPELSDFAAIVWESAGETEVVLAWEVQERQA